MHTHQWRLPEILDARRRQHASLYAEWLGPDGQAGLSHEVGDRVVKELVLLGVRSDGSLARRTGQHESAPTCPEIAASIVLSLSCGRCVENLRKSGPISAGTFLR